MSDCAEKAVEVILISSSLNKSYQKAKRNGDEIMKYAPIKMNWMDYKILNRQGKINLEGEPEE